MKQVEVRDLEFGYRTEPILKDLSFSVEEGQIIMILGENGSGKSTLLKLLLGELEPRRGQVKLLGTEVGDLKSFQEIGYVPQVQNFNQIAFPITVLEMVTLSLYREFGLVRIPRREHKNRAKEVLNKMELGPYVHTPYNELSGGLKQRTMIARALMHDPKLLILDEPTAGVDQESKVDFLKFIMEINQKNKITVVVVTHEMKLLQEVLGADKIYEMRGGKLEDVAI